MAFPENKIGIRKYELGINFGKTLCQQRGCLTGQALHAEIPVERHGSSALI
jgi:hypothetical protein